MAFAPPTSVPEPGGLAGGPLVWGIALGRVLDASSVASLAREAESLGYDEVWVSNERFHREMLVALGAAAVTTDRVGLGTFVADPRTMHPVVTAGAMATLDELSGGRAILGFGAGASGFRAIGASSARPVTAVREALEVIGRLLRGEEVTFHGSTLSVDGARLQVGPAPHLPIVLASQSPNMLRLAGEISDQAMISTYADARLFRQAMSWVEEGAGHRPAGRAPSEVIARIDVALDENVQAARDALRSITALMLAVLHPRWDFLDAIGADVPPAFRRICEDKNFTALAEAQQLVPDDVVDACGWAGDPQAVACRVLELVRLGVRRFVVLPHAVDHNVAPTIRAFASEVVPAVSRALM